MRLTRLTVDTEHFEDYLSFFTEVLEFDLLSLGDTHMEIDLRECVLLVRKGSVSGQSQAFEFALDFEEFHELVQRVNFFYYRKGPTRFLLKECGDINCELIDPDGRRWRFSQPAFMEAHFSSEATR